MICGIYYTELTQPEEIAMGVCLECLPDLELERETPVTGEGRSLEGRDLGSVGASPGAARQHLASGKHIEGAECWQGLLCPATIEGVEDMGV